MFAGATVGFGLLAAAAFTACDVANAAPVPDVAPIQASGAPARGHGVKCVTEPGHALSLGCTRMIEGYRQQIRKEIKNCNEGRIVPDECARALNDFGVEIKELSYSPAVKTPATADSAKAQNAGETNCHAPAEGQVLSAGCAQLVEVYRESLRGETFECETANIPAKVCAQVLPYFRARLANLGFSPQ